MNAPACKHCGSPVPDVRDDGFCCAGCAFVFQMLHEAGFEQFYDFKSSQTLPPVSPQALREQDYSWLERLVADGRTEVTVSVQGLSCIGCVWLIERIFICMGGSRLQVDVTRGDLTMTWESGRFDPVAFARELQRFGYLPGPRRSDEVKDTALERRTGVCGAFAMNAMAFSLPAYFGMPADFMFAKWFDLITAMSATMALIVGGSYFAERSWRSLRAGVLHIDTPITLGIIAAYLGSLGGWAFGVAGLKYFDFVATFIFLMLAGRWVQQAAVARNRRKLLRDPSISDTVTVDGQAFPVSEIKPGDCFEIKTGQAMPVAAELVDAHASLSLEWINGETETWHRSAGQLVPSGALNIGIRPVAARALETWERSTLRRLLEARREGTQRDMRLEMLLRVYLGVVVLAGVVGAVAWWITSHDVAKALQVMISIFVVSCPCALGVAAPFADELAASRAEKLGIFARTIGLWKKLTHVRKVVFDKTGTLTLENPMLADRAPLLALDATARNALRHLVSGNLHPVSRSLFDALGPGGDPFADREVIETPGVGLSFTDAAGHEWCLGRGSEGDSVFTHDGAVLAGFQFRDQLRDESVGEIQRLQRRGCDVFILSGDHEPKVAAIAAQLSLPRDHWRHSLLPEEKAAWITARDHGDTLYFGDGANDSLAFDAASCAGSPVGGRSFLEQKSDFYFLGHSLRFTTALLDIAQRHRRAVHRVFGFALSYNIATVAAGLMGHLSPLAAAILMPASSLVTLSLVAFTFRRRSAREEMAAEPSSSAAFRPVAAAHS